VRAFQRYGGNETEFLCYDCLIITRVDVEIEARICASCKSSALRAASRLAQTKCPKCREGHFDDGRMTAVS
jgi:Zn finger protein HypA/HybF involved in hydrogenase expression